MASLSPYNPQNDDDQQAEWERVHDPVAYNQRLMNGALNDSSYFPTDSIAGPGWSKYLRLLSDKGVQLGSATPQRKAPEAPAPDSPSPRWRSLENPWRSLEGIR